MKRFWAGTAVVVAGSVVLEIVFHHLLHAEYFWHSLPGFDFVYGLAGSGALVLVAKGAGKQLLARPESYYDGKERER